MAYVYMLFGILLAWLGVTSVVFAFGNWERDGAFMPLLAGIAVSLLALGLMSGSAKRFWRKSRKEREQLGL